jgi:hypothetical protein
MAHIAGGRTSPDSTDWQQYSDGNGIFVDADRCSTGFRGEVVYITSLGGRTNHWATTGGSSVYPGRPLPLTDQMG